MVAPSRLVPDPLRPPPDQTRKLIERQARTVATLAARRRKLLKTLADVDQQLRHARRLLRDVIHDAVPPLPSPGPDDDEPLRDPDLDESQEALRARMGDHGEERP